MKQNTEPTAENRASRQALLLAILALLLASCCFSYCDDPPKIGDDICKFGDKHLIEATADYEKFEVTASFPTLNKHATIPYFCTVKGGKIVAIWTK